MATTTNPPKTLWTALIGAVLAALVATVAFAQAPAKAEKSFEDTVAGLEKFEGFFDIYWDSKEGTVHLATDAFDQEFFFVPGLAAGVGSNDIGLDRGQIGQTKLVELRRVGKKILLVHKNTRYRAASDSATEVRSVDQAFAESVLWGFTVKAESDDGKVLFDVTPFLLSDQHGVAARLRMRRQGSFRLDASRSATFLPRTKSFPRNTELEATLTFTGNPEGAWLRSVTPTPSAVTVRQHLSFIQLPEPGYEPRPFDPRSGYISTEFSDYAQPIESSLQRRYIIRHRLEKRNPDAETSEAVEPIVYYLDPGTPEPVRSALIDGALWWDQAFAAAGYRNAFQVEMLPEDADPLDVRYNVIQWVHRSTRGWSYGGSITDPRTGEILKGIVTLGSLRVRQDYMIAQALVGDTHDTGSGAANPMLEMALARLRQLSAHEVGHTIGLVHNFAASANDRASVMDYPHPQIGLDGQQPTLGAAYATDIGAWDKRAVIWGYQDFPDSMTGPQVAQSLEDILEETRETLYFLTDQDGRPKGGASPITHIWDNGGEPAEELEHLLDVRASVLARFGEGFLQPGETLAKLEDMLVPLYLVHRYQLDAAAKVVGGLDYRYAVKGDGQVPTELLDPERQRRALAALLRSLDASELTLPESVLAAIPPPTPGKRRGRENFPGRTGVTFDPLTAADVAADLTLGLLLHPERAGRLVIHPARDADQVGLFEVLDRILERTWQAETPSGVEAEVQRIVQTAVVRHLERLSLSGVALPQARAAALAALQDLNSWLLDRAPGDRAQAAHYAATAQRLEAFLDEPGEVEMTTPVRTPDGDPIGSRSTPLFAGEEVLSGKWGDLLGEPFCSQSAF
ncbi:MAG: zinc-dependent metalloprotease [Acidobacteriota bacterium]